MNVLEGAWFTLQGLLSGVFSADWFAVAMKFFPFVALFELPVQATVMLGALRHHLTRDPRAKERKKYGLAGARKRFQYSKR